MSEIQYSNISYQRVEVLGGALAKVVKQHSGLVSAAEHREVGLEKVPGLKKKD